MVWIIYFLAAVLSAAILTRFRNIKYLWRMGLATILFLYLIDSTLVSLGAYLFNYGNLYIGGVPLFYLLAGFPGGILLAYFYPSKKKFQMPYLLLTIVLFLLLEIIMEWFGFIQYGNWNSIRSFFLNLGGFMSVLWLGQWLNATGKGLGKNNR